jgi:hypothetical protein
MPESSSNNLESIAMLRNKSETLLKKRTQIGWHKYGRKS